MNCLLSNFFSDLFTNPWFIGIGGGIISGIVVFFVTNFFVKRKDKSKHLELIKNANRDMIRSLQPYVVENGLPEKEIIDAIILSTARKYNVKSEELFSVRVICEELIREIVETIYVSSVKKQEYTAQLKKYIEQLNVDKKDLISDIQKDLQNSLQVRETHYQKRLLTIFTMIMSVSVSALTLFSVLFSNYNFEKNYLLVLAISIVSILIFFSVYVLLIIIQRKNTKKKGDNNIVGEDKNIFKD